MTDADRPFHDCLIDVGYRHVYWRKEERYWDEKENYWQRVKNYWREKKPITYVNLEALERMNLLFLQMQLLDKVAIYVGSGPASKTDATAEQISKSLHQYCQAVRDRQLISAVASKGGRDNPFMLRSDEGKLITELITKKLGLVGGEVEPVGGKIEPVGGKMGPDTEKGFTIKSALAPAEELAGGPHDALTWTEALAGAQGRLPRVLTPTQAKNQAKKYGDLPGGPWDYLEAKKEIAFRFGAGILAVVIFIGPMILMVLVKGTLCRLLTSGLCIVAFALGLAFWASITPFKQLSPFEVLTGTATYAAVLTVFVGAAM